MQCRPFPPSHQTLSANTKRSESKSAVAYYYSRRSLCAVHRDTAITSSAGKISVSSLLTFWAHQVTSPGNRLMEAPEDDNNVVFPVDFYTIFTPEDNRDLDFTVDWPKLVERESEKRFSGRGRERKKKRER